MRLGRRAFAVDRADEIRRTGGRRAARDVGQYACVRPARNRHLADPGRMARHHHPARCHRAPPADLGGQVPARVRIESFPMWIYDESTLRSSRSTTPPSPSTAIRRRISGDDHQGHPAPSASLLLEATCAAARRRRSACRGSTAARTARSSTPRSPARRSSRRTCRAPDPCRRRDEPRTDRAPAAGERGGDGDRRPRGARRGLVYDLKKRSFIYSDELCAMHDLRRRRRSP